MTESYALAASLCDGKLHNPPPGKACSDCQQDIELLLSLGWTGPNGQREAESANA